MNPDLAIFYFFSDLTGRAPALDTFIGFCLSDLPYLVVLGALVWLALAAYARREKIEIALVAAFSVLLARGVVTELIRLLYQRDRPFTSLDIEELATSTEWSFPSGHSAFFFALATAIYLYDKRWGTGFFLLAGVVALARVAAGIHWPSDILGGAGIGVLSALTAFWAIRRLPKNSL